MNRPFTIGLTGSIGMGKSTTGELFKEHGADVWNADDAVHRLYEPGGAGVSAIQNIRPEAVVAGAVSRPCLKAWIAEDPTALPRIEAVIHPLVKTDRQKFLANSPSDIVVLDIPLLFETAADEAFDLIVVVSAPPDLQRARVLARPGMSDTHFECILAKQMPDAEKREKADRVIETVDLETARQAVEKIVREIRAGDA
ncbi:MAG: dephospho-CoA kinase [Pseudomonadota bacterium]